MTTKLKSNQLGPWCSFCKPKTKRATHVHRGWSPLVFACKGHLPKLEILEKQNERMTEADQQTWGRL